jgi:hypothetical protein
MKYSAVGEMPNKTEHIRRIRQIHSVWFLQQELVSKCTERSLVKKKE